MFEVSPPDAPTKVIVLGQGYVGLPLAIRATEVGYKVVGFDVDSSKIELLRCGRSYVSDVSDKQISDALTSGFFPSADEEDLHNFDIAVVSVPTPLLGGQPDLSFVESAARMLGRYANPGCCIILESTTFPGTTEELFAPIIESVSGLSPTDYFLGYSPERIDPGSGAYSLVNTPKLVAGRDEKALEMISNFFSSIVTEIVPVSSCAEAEMAKLLENTFRHVNIALVNELARYAHGLGVNIWRVIEAASTKPFGFMRFEPGPGVGGHCLPIDPSFLSWRVEEALGRPFRFVDLANEINRGMPELVVERVSRLLNLEEKSLRGSRILLLGYSYKAGIGDLRESPSEKVANLLRSHGVTLSICDPYVDPSRTGSFEQTFVPFSSATLSSQDVVVVLVGHPEFDPLLIARASPLVLDTRNFLLGTPFRGEVL